LKDTAALIQEIDTANNLIWNLRTTPNSGYNPEVILNETLKKAESINYQFGIAHCLLNLATFTFVTKSDTAFTEEAFRRAQQIFLDLKNEKWIANSLLTHAIIKNSSGDPEHALYLGLKGINYYENHQSEDDAPMAYYVIGTIHKDLNKTEQALNFYNSGLQHAKSENTWTARILSGLSNIYLDRGDYDNAIQHAITSLTIIRQVNNVITESRALHDIGKIYRAAGNKAKAQEYLIEALNLKRNHALKHVLYSTLFELGELSYEKQNYAEAISFFHEAELNAIETSLPSKAGLAYHRQAVCYKQLKEFEKALDCYEKLQNLQNEINKQERAEKINRSEVTLLREKEEEIERLKNVELKNAYELIAAKNKEITDSINYAKRIQFSLIAHDDFLKKYLSNYFVLFHPKDIVSGDFYWAVKQNNYFFLAVCDSTGHGVPGAFMSLLSITCLNEAIVEKNILSPGAIFDFVRDKLTNTISREAQKDGFDGILFRIDLITGEVSYAAANNAPILLRNAEVISLEKNRFPVGHTEFPEKFSDFKLKVQKDDILYLYTDGFADQFGGLKGKKYKSTQLHSLISDIFHLTLEEQRTRLKNEFLSWQGEHEQVDDVCILAIKF
jgi:serine phosphatase RsbU (regulator of sigma subunit)